jgi:uncharacterized protein (DUF58 family)
MRLDDPKFLARLESLYLLARRVIGGSLAADRRSHKKGSGINFADYSEYQYGDDYRNIDWNIYARLETLVIKLFELEEDVSIHIFLDVSHSMQKKIDYAKQIAAAIGYIALCNQDKIIIDTIDDKLNYLIEPCRGKGKVMTLLKSLENITLSGKDTKFNEAIEQFQRRQKQSEVCVVISDFLFPEGYKQGLQKMKYKKNDIYCIQILDEEEMTCNYLGDLEIECIETGKKRKLTIGPNEQLKYNELIRRWNENLYKECSKYEIGYIQAFTSKPFDEIIRDILSKGGLIA